MLVIDSDPLGDLAPDQPPDAVQAVAFEELHASVLLSPTVMVAGVAVSAAVGTGAGLGAGVPLPPASLPQPASRTAKPAHARPGLLIRMKPYTHAQVGKGVGSCLRSAPAADSLANLCGQSRERVIWGDYPGRCAAARFSAQRGNMRA